MQLGASTEAEQLLLQEPSTCSRRRAERYFSLKLSSPRTSPNADFLFAEVGALETM